MYPSNSRFDYLKKMQVPIIQGGMGVRISHPLLARTVSSYGGLGLVSSVGLDTILIRELQTGDVTGEVKEVMEEYPDNEFASKVFDEYYISGGKDSNKKFKLRKVLTGFKQEGNELSLDTYVEDLITLATYVEVKRAKKGHDNPVGINFLHKIQWPLLPGIYGAMLAGADAIFIGAGFPKNAAKAMDDLSSGKQVYMPTEVSGSRTEYNFTFKPRLGDTKRSVFVGIISSHAGIRGLNDADDYVIEGPIAGGHNPPPRTKGLTKEGEPIYNEKDEVDIEKLHAVLDRRAQSSGRKPRFFLAGNYWDKLDEALSVGASGIQVGTPFAYSKESGMNNSLRIEALNYVNNGGVIFTDPLISPTGYPFKTLMMQGTVVDKEVYESRNRICDLNYLVSLFEKEDGKIGVRCPSEPVNAYLRKGGSLEDTINKGCLCNNLTATAGYASPQEPELITSGKNLEPVREMMKRAGSDYSATQVIDMIMNKSSKYR